MVLISANPKADSPPKDMWGTGRPDWGGRLNLTNPPPGFGKPFCLTFGQPKSSIFCNRGRGPKRDAQGPNISKILLLSSCFAAKPNELHGVSGENVLEPFPKNLSQKFRLLSLVFAFHWKKNATNFNRFWHPPRFLHWTN